jgi:hypothetical protein
MIRKNKKFIDPRYFMDEKMELNEQPQQTIYPNLDRVALEQALIAHGLQDLWEGQSDEKLAGILKNLGGPKDVSTY